MLDTFATITHLAAIAWLVWVFGPMIIPSSSR